MDDTIILFDLDGTLTDSGEGIINCAILALSHFGLPIPDRDTLRVFVGPPLKDSFIRFGVDPEKTDEAIAVYRGRYTKVGKFENFPYPGIRELLEKLKQEGHRLYVATSKPEDMSIEILDKFGLSPYFEKICGATRDGVRSEKAEVIAYLLEQVGDLEGALMVGDTAFDVLGAAEHGIPCAGVSWGYGTVESTENARAAAIVDDTQALLAFILGGTV